MVQVARKVTQCAVLAMLLLVPALARYNNYLAARDLDRVLSKWTDTLAGTALAAIDGAMRALPGGEAERAGRPQRGRTRVLEYAQRIRGGAWSAELLGLSMTDPLAGAEAIAASRALPWVLVAGLAVPVVLTLVLGRVFCSWICPAGFLLEGVDGLRRVLRLLEIHPRNVRVPRAIKYGVLAGGLVTTALVASPVLGYVYPPAVLGRELHQLVFGVFDRAEMGRFGLSLQGLSWMMLVPVAIVVVEVALSRRWWCRYVCPGGALYSVLGAGRAVRVELAAPRCTACVRCVAACPMGLNPMRNQMGMECDNCGVCVAACGDDALRFVARIPGLRPAAGAGTAALAAHEERST
jgi:ferredoxin-type protein NapH